jgi:glutamyl-tRNA reductase
MAVLALGVSYRRASVELLERLAFVEEDLGKAYRRLKELPSVGEAVLLSTCNRVEVYAEVGSYHAGFLDLKRFLAEARELDPDHFAEPLYAHYEDDAAEHVLRVAAGLDSLVLGEPQILSQVRAAWRRAEEEGAAGPALGPVFRAAIRTGRRVRAETALGASPAAFVEQGVSMAETALGPLAGRSALVVGAGGMATLAARHLRALGVAHLRVVNRSVERARRLAAQVGGEAGGLEALAPAIARADLVVSSTGAAGAVIGAATVAAALERRPREAGPLFLLDLAVPRDVEPAAAELPGVAVADIDDLRVALHGTDAPMPEVAKADTIVAEEVARFVQSRRAARLAPLLQALQDRGARIEAAELARVAPRLSELTDRQWAAVEQLAAGIVAKLLHEPIVRLRARSEAAGGDALARAVVELFGLDPGTAS